jgi:hypothetical protein
VSLKALSWAAQARAGSPRAKLLLLAYADHAQDDGTGAFCSVQDLAQYAECPPEAVRFLVQDYLVEQGFLRPSPDNSAPVGPDHFDLAMSEETRIAWRDEYP